MANGVVVNGNHLETSRSATVALDPARDESFSIFYCFKVIFI